MNPITAELIWTVTVVETKKMSSCEGAVEQIFYLNSISIVWESQKWII